MKAKAYAEQKRKENMSRLSQKASKKVNTSIQDMGVKTLPKTVSFAKGDVSVIQEEPSMVADTTNNEIHEQVLIPEPSRKDMYQRID